MNSLVSPEEFWPILCSVKEIDASLFAGLYCGTKKPSSIVKYLDDFVSGLLGSGVMLNDCNYAIHMDCFVCDALACFIITNV
jgi:hypothetical protein